MPALEIEYEEDPDHGWVTFWITHQLVDRSFLDGSEEPYPHGWEVRSVNRPEVKSSSNTFFLRGKREECHDTRMEVSSVVFTEIQDVIADLNYRYSIWCKDTSLEEEFFSRVRV